jgi:hypothetical protein
MPYRIAIDLVCDPPCAVRVRVSSWVYCSSFGSRADPRLRACIDVWTSDSLANSVAYTVEVCLRLQSCGVVHDERTIA